jgi:hypothetical protein
MENETRLDPRRRLNRHSQSSIIYRNGSFLKSGSVLCYASHNIHPPTNKVDSLGDTKTPTVNSSPPIIIIIIIIINNTCVRPSKTRVAILWGRNGRNNRSCATIRSTQQNAINLFMNCILAFTIKILHWQPLQTSQISNGPRILSESD